MRDDLNAPPAERELPQRLAVLFCAFLQVLVPVLPALGVGTPIGEQSDEARTLMTPAGWTFSIWGLLYLGSIAYAVYQFLPGRRRSWLLDRIGWWSAGAFLGNAAWAGYTQAFGVTAVSVAIIILTLLCLLVVYTVIADTRDGFSAGEQVFVVLPLTALAAWLTAATIVNVAASLDYYGIGADWPVEAVAGAVVLTGGLIAGAAVWSGRGAPWFALVFLWALAGIFATGGRESAIVAGAVGLAALIVVGVTVARLGEEENRRLWFTARSSPR